MFRLGHQCFLNRINRQHRLLRFAMTSRCSGKATRRFFKLLVYPCVLSMACLAMRHSEAKPQIQEQTFRPYLASNLFYDSNYLRFSDSVDPQSITGTADKSELITQLAAGLDVDWKHSLQQVLIKADVQNNDFANFSDLGYVGWKNLAQWNWQLQSNLSGEIGYANTRSRASYVQLHSQASNPSTH